jgi:hypothetical protein
VRGYSGVKAGVLPWQLVGSERPIANPLIIIYLCNGCSDTPSEPLRIDWMIL